MKKLLPHIRILNYTVFPWCSSWCWVVSETYIDWCTSRQSSYPCSLHSLHNVHPSDQLWLSVVYTLKHEKKPKWSATSHKVQVQNIWGLQLTKGQENPPKVKIFAAVLASKLKIPPYLLDNSQTRPIRKKKNVRKKLSWKLNLARQNPIVINTL